MGHAPFDADPDPRIDRSERRRGQFPVGEHPETRVVLDWQLTAGAAWYYGKKNQ